MKTKTLITDNFTGEILSSKIITRRPNGSIRVATRNSQPSRTDQQYTEEADINNIMRRYEKTGQLPSRSSKIGIYADVSQLPDLLTASNIVHDARTKFEALPSKIRERFANDPAQMIKFLQNPQNLEEAQKLGLLSVPQTKNDDLNDDNLKAPKQSPKTASPKKTEPE